ncbi:MAG: HlyC/CorC family transporter [Clostridia bacterium]|nr:HlyC/CorC family transporter [Clostridia bacterium]
MPDGSVPLLIAIIGLILLSGFFSSMETAYSCASRIKLRAKANGGNKLAQKTLKLAEDNYDRLISTILVGNNIVNITASTLGVTFFALVLNGTNVDHNLISTIALTVAVLIFGEITPKFIAKTYPEKMSMTFYPLIISFYYILFPINLIFNGWKWLISKVFRLKNNDVITEEEIMTVVEEAEEDGTLREEETNLIRQVIEFDDLEVGDILVPRVNIVALDIADNMEDFRKAFDVEGYSRIPVYKDTIDTVIGTVHQKDFFNAYLDGKKNVKDIVQDAFYTTEHAKISKLLKQLQQKKVHMAIVLDEYGGTLGIVTMEDILEELVGEIWDEHDEEINYFRALNGNTYLVDGKAPVSDMFEYLEMEFDDDDAEASTVGGWITEKLGEIPRAGTKYVHENLEIEVMKSTVKRIWQVKVIVKEQTKDKE